MKRVLVAASTLLVTSTLFVTSTFAVAQSPSQTPEQQVRQANTEVFQSIVQRNARAYDERVADDAIFVGFVPGIASKFKAFSFNMPADTKVQDFKVNNIQVKFESNTAIVVGRFWVKAIRGDKPSNTITNFMNVFARRNNRWQLIAANTHRE